MNYKLSKSKRIQAVIVLAIAALLVMTGTFAWYSFNQRRVNVFNLLSAPNVNLHDDFAGGPEKDVYVENSGVQPALVRVRLTELLDQNGVILPNGAVDDETAADWHIHTPSEVCEVCDFAAHEYFKWTMDGHKFYMPAPERAKGSQIDDVAIEPLAVGDLDAVIDYAKLLRTAFAGDSLLLSYIDEYLGGDVTHVTELQAAIENLDPDVEVTGVRQYDGQTDELTRYLSEVKLTLIPTQIITMQDWIDGTTYSEPCKTGDFWVMDTDGWCYWANALKSGEATGQLLSNVGNIKQTSGELIYKINVVLNATTFADTELNEFFRTAQANGGIGEDGMRLMLMASGGYVMGGDGELYADIGGVYRPVEKNNGSYVDHTLGDAIYAGADGIPGNDDDLKAGDAFSLGEDGGMTDGGDYTIEGFTVGENGVVYFNVGDGVYIVAVDENGNPDKNGTRYAPVSAGKDGTIGTADDEPVEAWYFYHIGNGVYIEVAEKGDTESKDEPVTYYFAGELLGESIAISNANGHSLDAQVAATFNLRLTVDDRFDVVTDNDGNVTGINMDGEYYTMEPMVEHEGDLYIKLGVDGYIGAGEDGVFISGGSGGDAGVNLSGGFVEPDVDGKPDSAIVILLPRPDGLGAQENPFTIKSRYKMDWVSGQLLKGNTFAGKYLEVVQSFSMGDSDFLPIGSAAGGGLDIYDIKAFLGTFDGKGYTISDLTITGGSFVGLFGYVGEEGVVQNVNLENVSIDSARFVGAVAGRNYGMILNCTSSGTVKGSEPNIGGIVGINFGTVDNCHNTGGTVEGTGNGNENCVGGVVGRNNVLGELMGEITNASNKAEVKNAGSRTGGVVGNNENIVSNCANTGDVTGINAVSGVVGFNTDTGNVTSCTNSGAVKGSQNVGGIVGNSTGTVQDCTNSGAVEGSNGVVGGVAGTSTGTITSCRNSGTVTSEVGGAGGIAGSGSGSITGCANNGNVTGSGNNVGGIAGAFSGSVTKSYSVAAVVGLNNVGGLVGACTGTNPSVKYCYAWGNVTGTGNNYTYCGTGGLLGMVGENANSGTFSDIYHAKGVINEKGTNRAGGIVGLWRGNVLKAYALATSITGTTKSTIGGTGTAPNCYYSFSDSGFTSVNGTYLAKPANLNGWNTVSTDFGNATIWRWDSTNQLPVLVGVTP